MPRQSNTEILLKFLGGMAKLCFPFLVAWAVWITVKAQANEGGLAVHEVLIAAVREDIAEIKDSQLRMEAKLDALPRGP